MRSWRRVVGAVSLSHRNRGQQAWIIKHIDLLKEARRDLVDGVRRSGAEHRYTPIIQSLPAHVARPGTGHGEGALMLDRA
jgi:hypothetical protein